VCHTPGDRVLIEESALQDVFIRPLDDIFYRCLFCHSTSSARPRSGPSQNYIRGWSEVREQLSQTFCPTLA